MVLVRNLGRLLQLVGQARKLGHELQTSGVSILWPLLALRQVMIGKGRATNLNFYMFELLVAVHGGRGEGAAERRGEKEWRGP